MGYPRFLFCSLLASVSLLGCSGPSAGILLDGSGGEGGARAAGGIGGSDVEPAELRVIGTSPRDGAADVELDATVSAMLDGPLDADALPTLDIELRDEHDQVVAGTARLEHAPPRVVFVPEEPFSILGQYTATVNRRLIGDPDDRAEYRWRFEARDGRWSEPLEIGEQCGTWDSKPQLAVTPSGSGLVAWIGQGSGYAICSRRFDPAFLWAPTVRHPGPSDSISVSNIALAVASNSDAVMASRQTTGGTVDIFAEFYDAGVDQWGTATPLELDPGGTNPPVAAMDDSGRATVVWQQNDGDSLPIYGARADPASGWSDPELLSDHVGARGPDVSVDASGRVVLAVSQFCGGQRCISVRTFTEGFRWTDPRALNPDVTGFSERPMTATNRAGQIAVVWHEADSNSWPVQERVPSNIWGSHYSPLVGWSRAQLLETEAGDVSPPHVAIAAWAQHLATGSIVVASRFTTEDGWDAPIRISAEGPGETRRVSVAMDRLGGAIAVWERMHETREVWTNRLDRKRGWAEPERVETGILDSIETEPAVALDASGRGMMSRVSGSRSVMARRFE